jgi:hypothetical protein
MAVRPRAPAHHDDDLGIGVLLDVANGLGQRLAGGVIKSDAAHD